MLVFIYFNHRDDYIPEISPVFKMTDKPVAQKGQYIILEHKPYRGIIAPCYDPEPDIYTISQVFIANLTGGSGCSFNNEQWHIKDDRIVLFDKPDKCLSVHPKSKIVYLSNINDDDPWQHWQFDNGRIISKNEITHALSLFPHTEDANKRNLWIYTIMTGDSTKYQLWKFVS